MKLDPKKVDRVIVWISSHPRDNIFDSPIDFKNAFFRRRYFQSARSKIKRIEKLEKERLEKEKTAQAHQERAVVKKTEIKKTPQAHPEKKVVVKKTEIKKNCSLSELLNMDGKFLTDSAKWTCEQRGDHLLVDP